MPHTIDRRDFLRAAGAGAVALGLGGTAVGCGAGEPSAEGTPGPTRTVTLTWWDYWDQPHFQRGINAVIKDVQEHVPGVTIRRRTFPFATLTDALTRGAFTGGLPDIAIVDNVAMNPLGGNGLLADLTHQVKEWGQADSYYEGPWDGCQVDGKTMGIPNNSNCLALYYNTDMLRSAGVRPPRTWDELADSAHQLTRADRFGLALSAVRTEEGTFQFLPFLWQTGGDLDTFATDGATALAFLHDLVDGGSMSRQCVGWTQQDVNAQFIAGRAAIQINGPWQIPTLKASRLKWGVVPLPRGRTAATCLGGENWVVLKTSKHVDTAWQVIERTQQPATLVPYLDALGNLPARKDLATSGNWAKDPALKVFLSELAVAKPRLYGRHYADISLAVSEAEQAALTGAAGPEAAARSAAAKITRALEQQ
ncbi:ABC transporter substrate-binding protein [Streptomyces sp. NPDC052236]|uniref:ABC transporter substrate-binding protein n=1 Tax=Streptomyces sp. NPDC052236 TaxID=3365686 RepID=UPI0037CEA9FC